MQQALRELAQSAIHGETDTSMTIIECQHRSRSRSPCYASSSSQIRLGDPTSRAGAYGRTGTPPPPINSTNACYWADSTLGAVQAAFHKRGIQVCTPRLFINPQRLKNSYKLLRHLLIYLWS